MMRKVRIIVHDWGRNVTASIERTSIYRNQLCIFPVCVGVCVLFLSYKLIAVVEISERSG